MLRVLSNHITAHMNTSKLGLSHTFKCPEAFANCLKGIKNDLANCLFFFKIVLNAPGGLNFPKDKKKNKGWRSILCWGCTSKTVCGNTLIRAFSPSFLVCGIQSGNLSKYFRHTLCFGDWIFTVRRSNQYLLLSVTHNILYFET